MLYLETQFINLRRSTDGGASFERAIDGITDTNADALFIVPFVLDPNEPRRLWYGTRRLWRTDDQARNWTAASTVLDAAGKVSALAVSPADPNHVVAGLSNGFVFRQRNALTAAGGSTWARSQPRPGWVTSLAFDPGEPETVTADGSATGGSDYTAVAGT